MKKRFDLKKRLRKVFRGLYSRAEDSVKSFGRQTDEVLTDTPIDFSAPSIPYYENLASRISFVRVVLYMVLVVFVVGTLLSNQNLITYKNLYFLARDIGASTLTAQSQADNLSYPISSTKADFASYRGGLVVAGSEVVTTLSGSGRQTLSVNVAYADPCVRTSEKYALTFGRGEKDFTVYNSFVQVYKEITEYPVFEATVSDSGRFAVVTRSQDYTSDVKVYDSNMKPLTTYHLNGYVTGLSMNADGTCLGVTSWESVGGMPETKISMIRLGNRISEGSVQTARVKGEVGSTSGFVTGDRYAVLLSDRLMVVDTDASVAGEVKFDGKQPVRAALGSGRVAVLLRGQSDLSQSTLHVYDRNANEIYSLQIHGNHPASVSGGIDRMSFGENVLFLQTRDKLYRISATGDSMTSADISRDVLAILPRSADEVLVCTPAYASRLDKNDFQK